MSDTAYEDAMEARAEDQAATRAGAYVTRWEEDAAEDRWARKGVL